MPEIHMTCPGCERKLTITTTPWSEDVQKEREAVSRVVRSMFNDYYVEYMGSDLDWLTEFQARLDEEKKRDGENEEAEG